jgi:DNA-binding FadR family transcriptional regulator
MAAKRAGRAAGESTAIVRPRLADAIFDVLAKEILSGTLAPGAEMPSEGELAERFGASKLLVREAIHRLAESGLVAARQGAKTRVLDPEESTDLRLLDLHYRLAPDGSFARGLKADVLEKQYTQGLSLLEVLVRRGPAGVADELARIFHDPAVAADEASFAAAEERFWTRVAEAGGNRILLFEVRFWYRSLAKRPTPDAAAPLAVRRAFYVELARRLVKGDGAVEYYRDTLGPAFDRAGARTTR